MKKIKEIDIAVIGVIVTVALYVMNVLGTGVIVGGDIGHIDTGIPFYGFLAPVLFIAFAAFVGYYTKKYSMKKAFAATYVILVLPYAAYAALMIFASGSVSTPFIVVPMFLCMPVSSLFTYLGYEICDLLEHTVDAIAVSMNVEAYKVENWIYVLIVAVMLVPLIVAPVVYRFTKSQESED